MNYHEKVALEDVDQHLKTTAERCKNDPDKFIKSITSIFKNTANEDVFGELFDVVGDRLHSLAYRDLAHVAWIEATKYYSASGSNLKKSLCFGKLANSYASVNSFEKSFKYYELSLEYLQHSEHHREEALLYAGLGHVYFQLNMFDKTIEYFKKALILVERIDDRHLKELCWEPLAISYERILDYQKAILYYNNLATLYKTERNEGAFAIILNHLGNVYHQLANYERSYEYYEQVLSIGKRIQDKVVLCLAYGNLANLFLAMKDYSKSVEYAQKSIALLESQELKDYNSKASFKITGMQLVLGNILKNVKRYDDAIKVFENGLVVALESDNKDLILRCYLSIGVCHYLNGRQKKFQRFFEKSLEIIQETGSINVFGDMHLFLAASFAEIEDYASAYKFARASLDISELIFHQLRDNEIRELFFQEKIVGTYRAIVTYLVNLGDFISAFENLEKSKARMLLQLLSSKKILPSITVTSEFGELLKKEQEYSSQLDVVESRLQRSENLTQDYQEADAIGRKLAGIYREIEKHDRQYSYIRSGKSATCQMINSIMQGKERDIVLVEYLVTIETIYIFVLSSRNKQVKVVQVPISFSRLNALLQDFYKSVAQFSDYGNIGKSWLELSKYLTRPISKYIENGDLVCFVPYLQMHNFPLHALEINDDYVVSNNPVTYLPNASLLTFLENDEKRSANEFVFFGVDFEIEAAELSRRFGGETILGPMAKKNAVLEACKNKDILHFSCHGKYHYEDPLSAGLKLYDEILTAREIYDIRINSSLVTLSACESGLSDPSSKGDEFQGLTRAFLYAGASSILTSLWEIDTESTLLFMCKFYDNLKTNPDKTIALQKTHQRIMETNGLSHPYYWSAFKLIGGFM